MAQIEAFTALRYDLEKTGGLEPVIAPPYDVIDDRQRVALERRSPYNVVRIDLPRGDGDAYARAAETLREWRQRGVVVRDERPALWLLEQSYTGPDGKARTRAGFLARVRIEEYGPGRIRPHERTHPGPREDRLRLTRATRANLSPIFSLFDDRSHAVGAALERFTRRPPLAQATDDDGTVNRLWRLTDTQAIATLRGALKDTELLIADGHHRYETARSYAQEIGGEGPHRYVLSCLVALQDPGLTVFPTHRLLGGLRAEQRQALESVLRRDFDIEPLGGPDELIASPNDERITFGYVDAHLRRPVRLTLKDEAIADAALQDHAPAYRRLDTAVLEALILRGALGMSEEDIAHLRGLGYARDSQQALALVEAGRCDAAFFMAATPVRKVQEVAAAGESMPPKSTYFFPKVPTGLVFNPLE